MASNVLSGVYGTPKVTMKTPVTTKIDNRQVQNHDGAFVYTIDDKSRLMRFLCLGTEASTYYVNKETLTRDNAKHVEAMIKANGVDVVNTVVDVSVRGLAAKNDPALFVLAMCASFGDPKTKQAAYDALPKVARTGTFLFSFVDYVFSMRGKGRGIRTAISKWYTEKEDKDLAFQVVKYPSRNGWSHRDLLRLTHPKVTGVKNDLFNYIVNGWEGVGADEHPEEALKIVWATERLKTASDKEVVELVTRYRLPNEVIPTEKRSKATYEALLPHAGLTWILRNLGNLSKTGAIATGQYSNLNLVCDRLTDVEALKKARVHPLAVLVAHNTYASGKGVLGKGEWPVIQKVVDALNAAFHIAFEAVEPTGARLVLGLDVSGSMDSGLIAGMTGVTPRIATAAMALVTARIERNVASVAFTAGIQGAWGPPSLTPFPIGNGDTLNTVVNRMEALPMGMTDCSAPLVWATKNKIEADAFVLYSDMETNSGIHPMVALRDYRQKMGIDAKFICVGMTATEYSVADPQDAGSLNVAGFSSDVPSVISQFAAGQI